MPGCQIRSCANSGAKSSFLPEVADQPNKVQRTATDAQRTPAVEFQGRYMVGFRWCRLPIIRRKQSRQSGHSLCTGRCLHTSHALSTAATFHYLNPMEEYWTVKRFRIRILDGGIPDCMDTNEVPEPYHGIDIRDIRAETSIDLDKQEFEVMF